MDVPLNPEGARTRGTSCSAQVLKPVGWCYLATFLCSAGLCVALYVQTYPHKDIHSYQYAFPYECVASIAAGIATLNALQHICQHVGAQHSWALKGPLLLILSMVPVYACCSVASIIVTPGKLHVAMLLNALREFYEAFVLVAFMQFIAAFFGGTRRLARILDTDAMTMRTVFPMLVGIVDKRLRGCLSMFESYEHAILDLRVFPMPRAPGSQYVGYTYWGALQYAFVMLLHTLANFIMWVMIIHDQLDTEGYLKYEKYLKGVKAASNLWAMYNLLVLFEYLRESKNTAARMNAIRPVSKFVCIKLIVIFSLWQEVGLSFLAKLGKLPVVRGAGNQDWGAVDQEQTAQAAVSFLVCLEMVLFAQWHRYAYPYNEDFSAPVSDEVTPTESYNPHVLLRFSIFKMMDDVGYLLWNRVGGQKKAIGLLHKAKLGENVDMSSNSVLHRNFKYFELDANGEASLAQLQFMLVRSGVIKDWNVARIMLDEADVNGSGRLSYEELTNLVNTSINAGPVA